MTVDWKHAELSLRRSASYPCVLAECNSKCVLCEKDFLRSCDGWIKAVPRDWLMLYLRERERARDAQEAGA